MLATLDHPTALVGGAVLLGNIRYQRERRALYQRPDSFDFAQPIDPANIDPDKTGTAEDVQATPIAPVPTAFVGWPVSERVVVGVGVSVPYAAMLSFPDDGAQRWQLQSATIINAYTTPSISVRLVDWISVGAGASYVFGGASLSKIQDFAALGDIGRALEGDPINQSNDFGPDAPPSVRELNVMARPISITGATAHAYTFNAGIALTLGPRWTFGVRYQHRAPMEYVGDFTLDMDDDFFTQDLSDQGLEYAPRVSGRASIACDLPWSVIAGARWRVAPRWEVQATGGVVGWGVVDDFEVRLESSGLAQPELGGARHRRGAPAAQMAPHGQRRGTPRA